MKKPVKSLEELLDSVRNIEGFPNGTDEDILTLSDPPYYTACPNPYINDFIKEYGTPYDEETDDYHREPFVGDVSEGKNNSIYNAHAYHTKVPHQAIKKFIGYYTNENDIVFDGFSGTGMTGVAAIELKRNVVMSDLSSIGSFISYNYNKSWTLDDIDLCKAIITDLENEISWMFETKHPGKDDKPGIITNIIWSDVFICPYCASEIVFFNVAVKDGSVKNTFECQNCLASLTKDQCEHQKCTIFDEFLNQNLEQAVQKPVVVNYKYKKSKFTKKFDKFDEELLEKVNNQKFPFWVPTNILKDGDNTKQPINSHGFTHEHHFYTKRNLYILGLFYQKISKLNRPYLISFFTSILNNLTKRYRYRTTGGGGPSGNLYIPSISKEINPIIAYRSKIRSFFPTNENKITNFSISTQSATELENIANNSIDYIFTDPPFGSNIMYSEMSIFWESWIKIYTNDSKEKWPQ